MVMPNENNELTIEIYDPVLYTYLVSRRIDGTVEVKFQEDTGEPYFVFTSVERVKELTAEYYSGGLSEILEAFHLAVSETAMAIDIARTALTPVPNKRF